MLKTPVPVKLLLTALTSFCKDDGGRTENCFKNVTDTYYISFCTWHSVSPLSNFSKTCKTFLKYRKGHKFWFNV